jgi:hypothetical protein
MTESLQDITRTEKLEMMVDEYIQDLHYDLSKIEMRQYAAQDEQGFRLLMAAFMRAAFAVGTVAAVNDPEGMKEKFRDLGYKFE